MSAHTGFDAFRYKRRPNHSSRTAPAFGPPKKARVDSHRPTTTRAYDSPELLYHYDHDDDWVLQGHDLYPIRSNIQTRAKAYFALALLTELLMLAWPCTAIPVWGIQQAALTLAFSIHLFKALFLFIQMLKYTRVYKMYGRRNFSHIWGIWTRSSHVRDSFSLSTYGVLYGWVQIPLIVLYIIVALTAKPLIDSDTLYWIQWPMGLASLVQGYVAWCIIVSELAIRKQLEAYAPRLLQRGRKKILHGYQ